jgi:hypothetical protein
MEIVNAPEVLPAPPAKQPLISRLFWFGVGGGFSVMLNVGPFHWLRTHAGLPDGAALGISLTCVTIIFSIWNYFLNFRTTRGWKECQVRYLTAVGFCYLLTYTIALSGIKQWGQTNDLLAYAIVAATQVGVSGVKFLLYHHWVYPRTPASAAA